MNRCLLVKSEGLRQIVADLSESWSPSEWLRGGEELRIRPPHNEGLADLGYVYVTLTRGQMKRLVKQVAVADIEARYDAKLVP
jgi:hypothetical protein